MDSLKITPPAQISDYVVDILEDNKRQLWFATVSDGVLRYDGKTLTYFSTKDGLIDNTVAGIAQDRAGNMWFGTHNGVSKYDGKNFTNFGEKEGIHGPGCKILVDKNGAIWAGTNDGAFRYSDTALTGGKAGFSEFKIPNPVIENPSYKWVPGKIWSLIEDSNGNIWFGRDGYGACKYDGNTFTHFTKKDGLCSNNVSRIIEDNHGNIWFASITSDFPVFIKEGGVTMYDGKTFTQFPEQPGLTNNDIYTIYCDKSDNIWIGAIGVGAYRYSGDSFALFKEIDQTNELINYFGIQAILEDSKGILWFGFSGGLFRFNGKSFVNVTREGPWN
jgi:ligand-binding sensor domain-containing protein